MVKVYEINKILVQFFLCFLVESSRRCFTSLRFAAFVLLRSDLRAADWSELQLWDTDELVCAQIILPPAC